MEGTQEEKNLLIKKQKNVRLYPRYKMLSWDMLFYYSIIFLFFTQEKGISAADVLLAESFYPLFKAFLLIPATIIIEKIGKRKSLIIGNFFVILSTLTYILSADFTGVLIGEFFSAIGFIIKGVCESNMLYDSLERNEKRGSIFSKIDGRAASWYYYVDAISSIASGFLFAINAYIPMIICLFTNILSTWMAAQFEDIDDNKINKDNIKLSKEIKEIKLGMKGIFSSERLRNLILFGAIFSGILSALTTLRSSILTDINLPAQYFGIIFAILQIIAGIAAKNQSKFHNRFRNKTLAVLSVPVVISCIVIGVWCNIEINYNIMIAIILVAFLIQYIAKGPFYSLIKRYMNNFTTSTLRIKISSAYNLLEGLLRSAICFFASFLLRCTTTANTFIISGCIFSIVIILLLDRMRTKVGLKPEEYKDKDIKILELK